MNIPKPITEEEARELLKKGELIDKYEHFLIRITALKTENPNFAPARILDEIEYIEESLAAMESILKETVKTAFDKVNNGENNG